MMLERLGISIALPLSVLVFGTVLFGAGGSKEVVVKPGDNVQQIVDSNPAGTTFNFKAGTYRGVSIVPKDRDVFVAETGVVLTGSAVLRFQQRGNSWVATGQTNPDEEQIMRQGSSVQTPGGGPGGQGQGGGRGGQGGGNRGGARVRGGRSAGRPAPVVSHEQA